jgi:DNA-binding Lrp family transcriptional regulator
MDGQLASYATVRQLEYLEATEKHGSQRAAAKALGVDESTIRRSLDKLKAAAAIKGYSPEHEMTRTVPDGFKVQGVSSLYVDGKLSSQWVKATVDQERQAAILREAYEAMASDLPRVPAVPAPAVTVDHLATLYTFTDSHVGMLAWHKEGGADWDLAIAERTLIGCFEQMVNASPPASVGIVNQLGDFLHSDGLLPITPTSHHVLDQDGRFSKLVATAVQILRRVVDMALTKHQKVVLLLAEGNHDMASSVWLRVMFRALYENEPRVEVIDSELPYYAWRHGKTMLAFHHGHLKKNDQLPLLFASQYPELWGATTKRYAHVGHRHHLEEKEHSGMTVLQHPTLAARDAYAARGGWHAERAVTAITYHCEFGQVARNTVVPEMLA